MTSRRGRYRASGSLRPSRVTFLVMAVLLSSGARADVLLHEYIDPDPVEDLRLGATTSDGAMAAAIETQSGPLAAPDLDRSRQGAQHVYGGERDPGPTGSFHVDSNTSRPERVSYEDPFTPAVTPYKREFAFDTVDAAFDLVVANPALDRLALGSAARSEDDQFYADLDVDAAPATAVRIPTVGPGARVLAVRTSPASKAELFHDGADNWFVRTDVPGRLRLVLHLAIDRAAFGSPFASVEWARLARFTPPIPETVRQQGTEMARQIGVPDGAGPAETVRTLVGYFRGFSPSGEHPTAQGPELYRELVLSKKGVCRHRAYAFVVTALALGIPSRFVRNEAHAWVEVMDGVRWHRIDLGGAAADVDFTAGRVAHVPPRDPFVWPQGEDSGEAMASRSARARERASHGAGATGQQGGGATSPRLAPDAREESTNVGDARPPASLTLHLGGKDATRGARLRASGEVTSSSGPCQQVRVDLVLEPVAKPGGPGSAHGGEPSGLARIPLGTLVTNGEGRYEGSVVVPFTVPPGDYDVRATTPGGSVCGRGQSP